MFRNKEIALKNGIYLFPLILILAIPLLVYSIGRGDSRHLLAALITLLIPLFFLYASQIKPFTFVLISFPVLLLSIMYNTMAFDYDSYVSIGVWTAFFDTFSEEAVEYIAETRWITKLVTAVQILIYIFYLFHSYHRKNEAISNKKRIILTLFLFVALIDFASKGATKIAFPFRAIEGLVYYKKQKMYEVQFFSKRAQIALHAHQDSTFSKDQKETLILVVGESLRRDHLSYYQYPKPTSPLLEKEKLIIYSDAVSPVNQTVNALKRVFSEAEYENDSAYYQRPTFIKAFKETGFKTYWLSTQRMYGKHDSEVSFIAKECDSIIFRNPYDYDDILVDDLQGILKLDAPKKLIIIHIMGNHAAYYRRYRPRFDTFTRDESQSVEQKVIDSYDNSVLYNDSVLHQFLSKLKKTDGNAVFIMFSDHGESLYQSGPDIKMHSSNNPAKCEYEVPLVLWLSKQYRQNHPDILQQIQTNRNLPLITSDLYYSIPYLYGISFDAMKPEKNFFSNQYKPLSIRRVMTGSFDFVPYESLKTSYKDHE